MSKFEKWISDNKKWQITIIEKSQNKGYLNIHEKLNTMHFTWHIHLVPVTIIDNEICLNLQNNKHSKRIPKYVLQKAMSIFA